MFTSVTALIHTPLCCAVLCWAAAMLRVSGSLQKSGEVMKLVNDSLKLPEMQKTMFEMSKGETHCASLVNIAGLAGSVW